MTKQRNISKQPAVTHNAHPQLFENVVKHVPEHSGDDHVPGRNLRKNLA